MTRPRLVVVLGAPRSGTTWLQRMLAVSPAVASPQETHLFELYLGPGDDAWRAQRGRLDQSLHAMGSATAMFGRLTGLPSLLEEADLRRAQRAAVDVLVDAATRGKPEATVVVEKSPSNSLRVDLIEAVVPDARYVHIVRDPRAVMASLLEASRSWGERWAAPDPWSAATTWLRHYQGARRAAELAPDRYHELRYEDLRADPVPALARVLDFLDLTDDPAELVDREARATADGLPVFAFREEVLREVTRAAPDASEPTGFRHGTRRPLGPTGLRAARIVAGPAAAAAGYDLSGSEPRIDAAWAPLLRAQTAALRVRRRARRRMQR